MKAYFLFVGGCRDGEYLPVAVDHMARPKVDIVKAAAYSELVPMVDARESVEVEVKADVYEIFQLNVDDNKFYLFKYHKLSGFDVLFKLFRNYKPKVRR